MRKTRPCRRQPPLPDAELATFRKWIQGGLAETTGVARSSAANRRFLARVWFRCKLTVRHPCPPICRANPWSLPCAARPSQPGRKPMGAVGLHNAGQKQVLLLSTESREIARHSSLHRGRTVGGKVQPQRKNRFAGGGRSAKSGRVMVWDVVTGKPLITLGDDYDTVLAADVKFDQSEIAIGDAAHRQNLVNPVRRTSAQAQEAHRLGRHRFIQSQWPISYATADWQRHQRGIGRSARELFTTPWRPQSAVTRVELAQ